MIDISKYTLKFREDFSLMAVPNEMVKIPARHKKSDRDYSNTADKGYVMSPLAKRKIRSAALNLYGNATRDEQLNLRFVTFTFPSLPATVQALSIQDQDAFLHKIFTKFIDNERKQHCISVEQKPAKLEKYLWVNERQDGSRLKGSKEARNVIHYHTLLRYSANVNYWFANLRFLNLLLREGFDIFNSKFEEPKYDQQRNNILDLLHRLDYKTIWSLKDTLKIRVFKKGVYVYESIFLQPVDFDKKAILSIESLSKYLSAYISKDYKPESELNSDKLNSDTDTNKIYARRWGCSRGLVTKSKNIDASLLEMFPKIIENTNPVEVVDTETGEIYTSELTLSTFDKALLLKMFTLDAKAFSKEFVVEINNDKYLCYYFPSQFSLWAQMPIYRDYFKKYFNLNI